MTDSKEFGPGSPEPEPVRARGWVPVPDPTLLTMEMSTKMRDDVRRDISNLREIIGARLDSMDKATALLESHVVQCPSSPEIARLMSDMKDLFLEKFAGMSVQFIEKFSGIGLQFSERDIRTEQAAAANRLQTEQSAIANKTAIDAAFLANEKSARAIAESNDKAIAKSEAATKEKIDGLQALLTGAINDIRGQIAALTSRQDRGEGSARQVVDTRSERRENIGMIVGIAGLSAVVVSMLVGGILYVVAHGSGSGSGSQVYTTQPTVVSPAVVPLQPK